MTKTSKIIKCVFTNTSPAPDGKPIYYFSMQFENGDVGYCGRMLREPQDMKEGQNMEYEIIGTKIKYIKPQQQPSNAQSSERKKTTYKKAPDDFLGYAYAYAKDLVVAGKTKPKDISESIKTEYVLEIYCNDERHQESMFNELKERGFKVKVLTL